MEYIFFLYSYSATATPDSTPHIDMLSVTQTYNLFFASNRYLFLKLLEKSYCSFCFYVSLEALGEEGRSEFSMDHNIFPSPSPFVGYWLRVLFLVQRDLFRVDNCVSITDLVSFDQAFPSTVIMRID